MLILLIVVIGCRKNGDKTNWHIDALAPLVYSSLTIDKLVPDSLVSYNDNGLVSLVFSDTLLKFELDTLIQLPDTTIVSTFSLPIFGITVPPGTAFSAIEDEIEINSNDIELKYAKIRSGKIVVELVSTFKGPILCTFQIPGATLNGESLSVTQLVPAATEDEASTVQHVFDVSGYKVDFTNGNEPFNHLPTVLNIMTDPDGEPLLLQATDNVLLTTTFQDLTPEYAEGYFGQQLVNTGSERESFDAFNFIESGTIDLNEVDVNLKILNGFGVDIRATLFQFDAENQLNNSVISLNHPILGSPINLNRATHPDGYPVPSVYELSLNQGNSDIDQMLESFPDAVAIEADLELNPLGNISAHHDFAYAESRIDGIIDVKIPLSLIADNVVLADTMTFSAGSVFDNILSGNLMVRINNGFPLEGFLSLYAFNSEDENTVLILNNGHFASGITNAEQVVVTPQHSEILIPFDTEIIEHLNQSDKLIIRAQLTTSSLAQYVNIYKHYAINVKLVGDFNYHVND